MQNAAAGLIFGSPAVLQTEKFAFSSFNLSSSLAFFAYSSLFLSAFRSKISSMGISNPFSITMT